MGLERVLSAWIWTAARLHIRPAGEWIQFDYADRDDAFSSGRVALESHRGPCGLLGEILSRRSDHGILEGMGDQHQLLRAERRSFQASQTDTL
jgi:hypothetical protein